MSSDPIVEVHYIKQPKNGAAPIPNLINPNQTKTVTVAPVLPGPPMPGKRLMPAPQQSTKLVVDPIPSGVVYNEKFDRYTYQPNGTYTHVPYDVQSMKSGFKTYYDNVADVQSMYWCFCCYNNWNRCNNCFRCCKDGIGYPVYCWIIFFILFLLMLFLFIMLGLAGSRVIG